MLDTAVGLVVVLIVAGVLFYGLKLIINTIPMEPTIKGAANVIIQVLALIVVVVVLLKLLLLLLAWANVYHGHTILN